MCSLWDLWAHISLNTHTSKSFPNFFKGCVWKSVKIAKCVKNKSKSKYAEMSLKYIYFMHTGIILQIHLHIYVLNKNTLQLYCCCPKRVYLKSAKLEQLILCLMHFNCAEVKLKIYWSICDCAKVELLQVYFRYTLNILHLKTDII